MQWGYNSEKVCFPLHTHPFALKHDVHISANMLRLLSLFDKLCDETLIINLTLNV